MTLCRRFFLLVLVFAGVSFAQCPQGYNLTGGICVANGPTLGSTLLNWDSTNSLLTVGNENLVIHSEPVLANVQDKSGTVTQASFTENSLTNGIGFPAASEADFAEIRAAEVLGEQYTFSAYVVMTDGSAPVVGTSNITGDFQLVIANTAYTGTSTVSLISGSLYRVSGTYIATSFFAGVANDFGVTRATGQSAKGFRVTGWQINIGPVMLPYAVTTTVIIPLTGTIRTGMSGVNDCANTASPAVCASAISGSVVIAAAATSVVVNTSAVTATSRITLTTDSSLGTLLAVTCNTQSSLVLGTPHVTARTAGTSFTVAVDIAPTSNPLCFGYLITK